MLGWEILKIGERKLKIKRMSSEEEELIKKIESVYGEKTKIKSIMNNEEAEESIKQIMSAECEKEGLTLDYDQERYMLENAVKHIFGFGPLEELMDNDEIEEISIIGIGKPIYIFERNRGWMRTNVAFNDEEFFKEFVNKIIKKIGRTITLKKPRVNGVMPNGSRVHATAPPISQCELTIRKFRMNPYTPKELVSKSAISLYGMAFLSLIMQSDSNVIISGNTASGKTTTMNSLFTFIPKNERVLLIEETPEINILHEHQIRLVTNENMKISLSDLVHDSLRMRPDRTVIGEVRKPDEIEAMVDIMLSGQARGSYCTMHGRSFDETVQRLKSLGCSESETKSVDLILVQKRRLVYDRKKRKNREIREIVEIGSPRYAEYFKANENEIKSSDTVLEIADKLGFSKKEMFEEIKTREKIISKSDNDFIDYFENVQKSLYGFEKDDRL
ncbi:MAG: ATPase, T2SS/T4P/T4SS family [Candidatus ainarchaeum sp.]|nr:ATPase, T2SS/T4P/T4SS family [Candidatus ainarchaeum sp.]